MWFSLYFEGKKIIFPHKIWISGWYFHEIHIFLWLFSQFLDSQKIPNIYFFPHLVRAIWAFSPISKMTVKKKSHAKYFHPISPKLNQTILHICGLILIQYGVNWSKIVAVTFFFDKFNGFCRAPHPRAHFSRLNAKKLLKSGNYFFVQKLRCMQLWCNSN